MSEEPKPASSTKGLEGIRNLVVAAMLGGGSLVMLSELWREHATLGTAAVVAGAALAFFLPRPIDIRSGVYAFFVPISMTYGAAMQQYALLAVGAVVGVSFLLEKTTARPKPPSPTV